MQTYEPQNEDDWSTVDLFENASKIAMYERKCAQREELHGIATKLDGMFQSLSNELLLDRERALALMAEYTGLFDDLVSQINAIRDGGIGKGLEELAERLEQGLQFLIGCFTAHQPTRKTWRLDRTEIKGNIQKVWPTLSEINFWFSSRETKSIDISEEQFPKAA